MIIDQKKVINLSITFVVTVVIFLIIQSLITRNSNLDLEKLSLMAFEDPSTEGNPKKISKEDLKLMYENSISGKLFK